MSRNGGVISYANHHNLHAHRQRSQSFIKHFYVFFSFFFFYILACYTQEKNGSLESKKKNPRSVVVTSATKKTFQVKRLYK